MIKLPPIEDAFVNQNGLILFNPDLCTAAEYGRDVDVFLGYEAAGFAAASTLALLSGREAGLLRAERKKYGLERILETRRELRGTKVCIVHAGIISEAAQEAVRNLDCSVLAITPSDSLADWPADLALGVLPEPSRCAPQMLRTYSSEEGFILSSGVRKQDYVDVLSALLDPATALSYAAASGADIALYDSVVGMAKGGIFLAVLLALANAKRPTIMDHAKQDYSLVSGIPPLGRTLLVDETIGSGDYFRIATSKLASLTTSIDYFVAVRFSHRGSYEFPVMAGATV